MSQDNPEYKVGYSKPPTANRFKKGQSGNLKGRPKGAKGFNASLQRELKSKVTVREGERAVRISKAEAAAKRLVERALKGDMAALRMVMSADESETQLIEALMQETPLEVAMDQTDEAVLSHFQTQTLGGRHDADDEGSEA